MSCMLWHDWEYSIKEKIKESDASTGRITYGIFRYCSSCNAVETYYDNFDIWYHPDCYWNRDDFHKQDDVNISLIDYITRRLKDSRKYILEKEYIEGDSFNFIIKSPENGNVVCKIVTDKISTHYYNVNEYIRYRIFTFEITPKAMTEKEYLATFSREILFNELFRLLVK